MGKPVQLIPSVLSKSNIINNRQFEHSRCDYTIIPFFKFFSDGQNDTRSMQKTTEWRNIEYNFLTRNLQTFKSG